MNDSINRWLLTEGRCFASVPELQDALAERLGVDRLWIGTKVLHPQAAAYVWVWTPQTPTRTFELSYDRFAKLDSVDSPVQRLRLGAASVRFRREDGDPGMPDVAGLWEQGFTDLYGLSMRFRGEWVGGYTFATKAAEGFDSAAIELFDAIEPTLSAVIEPLARDMMFATLLRTYLGDDAGTRVAQGQVRRGDSQSLRAAIWFSDLRGFTRLSEQLDRDALLALLNDVFDAEHIALKAHGGQVLKFIGDGLLAVFVDESDDGVDVCTRAAAAADELQTRLASLRDERRAAGLAVPEVGVGLHYGEVTYGNVGAPVRLDFTVIGPAVNLAARVEGLCGKLGVDMLATQAFVDRSAGWVAEGQHALKGVRGEVPVFRRG